MTRMRTHPSRPVSDHRQNRLRRCYRAGAATSLALLLSCDLLGPPPISLHDRYAERLREAGLAAMPAAVAWLESAERALDEPDAVTLPLEIRGWFDADSPAAIAVRFPRPAERWVRVEARFSAPDSTRLFLDAFHLSAGSAEAPELLASAGDTARALSFRVRGSDDIVVRMQPELLRGGAWRLRITTTDEEPVNGGATMAVDEAR